MPSGEPAMVSGEAGRQLAGGVGVSASVTSGVLPGWTVATPDAPVVQRCTTFRRSLGCAWRGILATFVSQRNMRIQSAIAAGVLVAGLLLRLQPLEWVAIVLSAAAVFVAEITNTALETIVDLVSPGYSEPARLAKDAAAGAVLVAALASVIVGLLVLGPHLLHWLRL